jgi:hypothetical protein
MTACQLEAMLSRCDSLAEFTYISSRENLLFRYPDRICGTPVLAEEVTDILNNRCPHLCQTLRRLTLEHMPTENQSYETDYSPLDNLYRLKQVCLGANGLFAKRGDRSLSNLLPQNVSSIDIFLAAHWEERTVHAISRLLADIESGESGFWDLKDIRIWHDIPPVPYDEEPIRSFHLYNSRRFEPIVGQSTPQGEWLGLANWQTDLEKRARELGIRLQVNPREPSPLMKRLQNFCPTMSTRVQAGRPVLPLLRR